MRRPILLLLLACSGVADAETFGAVWDERAPFVVRDQNPLLAGFGLPSTMPSRLSYGFSGGVDVYWGSTALIQQQGNEGLVVDAETREARIVLQGTIKEAIGWHVQIPYRYTGGGNLDDFIDEWHHMFSLADGARSSLPTDQIGIQYTRAGARLLDITSSATGLGDVHAALGYKIHSSPPSALIAWLDIKLPTGDADKLDGSGAADVSLVLSGRHRLSDRWSIFGQAAGTWLGDGDLLPEQQRSTVWSGMAGVSIQTWRGLSLKAQIDAHTAAYDSDLDFFSNAVLLTGGADYLFESGWRLELGISEDLVAEHSPDVVFLLSLKRSPR